MNELIIVDDAGDMSHGWSIGISSRETIISPFEFISSVNQTL